MPKEAYVYIVASRSRTLYIDMTTNLDGRIFEHKNGIFDGFSKDYNCTRLVYYEVCNGPLAAISREKQLKGWRREKKIALIEKQIPHGKIWQKTSVSQFNLTAGNAKK